LEFNKNRYKNSSIAPNFDKISLSKFDRIPLMLSTLLKKSIAWILGIVLSLTLATSVGANAPMPPSLYWLKFDVSAKLQSVQIAQCQDKDCQKSILLKQYGACTKAGCLSADPKLVYSKPLQLDCAERLCLVALSPFYNRNDLDPSQVYFIAQLDDLVSVSKVFPLNGSKDRGDRFAVRVAGKILALSPSPAEKVTNSPLFQNLFLVFLTITLGVESIIWAGYLRWKQVAFTEIKATILSVFIVHAFSFAIVWVSFPGFQHFASQSMRYSGLVWLGFSLLYGAILSLYLKWTKRSLSNLVAIGSIAYWSGAAFVSLMVAALFGYGSPLPLADGLSEPMAILASELIVVGYEAWIIQRLRRDRLDFKTALLLSSIANTASCLFGLAFSSFANR
jgi:hypothetical protein